MMSCYLKTKQYEECIGEGAEVLAYDAMNLKLSSIQGIGKTFFDDEVSLGDETIADSLRHWKLAEERLNKEGGRTMLLTWLILLGIMWIYIQFDIEDITEEATILSDNCENSTSKSSLSLHEPLSLNLNDDPESIRSFPNFISRTDPETLSAMNGGKVEGVPPDMIKTATDVIGKMSPEEVNKMFQLASSEKWC
ncbi:outer envelope protein 61-like [Salvia divinorum]|uniref:Outer envelope protein 61-like n=1 Tax=Salvia divinorum TaxID=28513 RepID=A0ABD1GIR4_SALDI